jgi:hypothetical protein
MKHILLKIINIPAEGTILLKALEMVKNNLVHLEPYE